MNNVKLNPRYVNSFQLKDVIPLWEVLNNPRKAIANLSLNKRKVLNYLLFISNRYEDLYMRQSSIAKALGLTRESVSRIISSLCALRLLNKITRPNKSCLYRMSSWFMESSTRNRLKDILFSLTFLSLNLLRSGTTSHDIIKGNIFIQKQNQKQVQVNYDYKESSDMKSQIISRLAKTVEFDAQSLIRLNTYPETVLLAAERSVKNSKGVTNKAGYFFSLCKKLVDNLPKDSGSATDSVNFISDNFGLKDPQEQVHFKAPMYGAYKPAAKDINISETWRKPHDQLRSMHSDIASSDKLSKSPELRNTIFELFDKSFVKHQFIDEFKADDREKRKQLLIKKSRQDERFKTIYGQTQQNVREEEGLYLLGQLLNKPKPVSAPVPVKTIDPDDAWWSTQQPMDIEDFYQV